MDDKYRSRKFALTLLTMSLASLFLGMGMVNEGTWMTVMLAGLGMYATSNVMEKKYAGSA